MCKEGEREGGNVAVALGSGECEPVWTHVHGGPWWSEPQCSLRKVCHVRSQQRTHATQESVFLLSQLAPREPNLEDNL